MHQNLFQQPNPNHDSDQADPSAPPFPIDGPLPYHLWRSRYPRSIMTLALVLIAKFTADVEDYVKGLDNSSDAVKTHAELFDEIYSDIGALLLADAAGHMARASFFFQGQPIIPDVPDTSESESGPLSRTTAVCTGPVLPEIHARLMNLIGPLSGISMPPSKSNLQPTYVHPQLVAPSKAPRPAHIPLKTVRRQEAQNDINRLAGLAPNTYLLSEQVPTSSVQRDRHDPTSQQTEALPMTQTTTTMAQTQLAASYLTQMTYQASTSSYGTHPIPLTAIPRAGVTHHHMAPPSDLSVASTHSRVFDALDHARDVIMLYPPSQLDHNTTQAFLSSLNIRPDSEPRLAGDWYRYDAAPIQHGMPTAPMTTTMPPLEPFQRSAASYGQPIPDAMGQGSSLYNNPSIIATTSSQEHERQFGNASSWPQVSESDLEAFLRGDHHLPNSRPLSDNNWNRSNYDPGAGM
ncbi:hypothetical protein BJ165DRAFT_1403298 [Panaeolus papilionaceus]|nr:hypothetical protein BJ165DRAFT_1403298 [Panaeolus papilionaceus]